jgi:pimeloyl-ACP methyl ester carboxylesterase
MFKGMFYAAVLSAVLAASAAAQAPDPKVAHADYANPALWLCRPDLKDNKCKVDLDATVIAASGKTTVEKFVPAKDPKIDCFFVYPTVSLDPGWQSDFVADRMEWDDIKLQFARFGAVCRTFAPIYRQTTLTALRVASGGAPPAGERPPQTFGGYNDVVDAWNYYLAHDNKGRGVVLIGHSQGAGVIARLAAAEIDGKPVQKQLISALVLGSPVLVPAGQDVGGTFKTIPLCRAEDQLGCVINYSTFRDTNPPPPESRFGRGRGELRAACTNPADLKSGKGTPDNYFLTQGFLNGSGGKAQPDWTTPPVKIGTPFVKVPGLLSTECQSKGDFTWLAMHVNADPKDPRTDVLAGEIIRPTGPDWSWGLHLIDVDHSMGDLVRIVRKQAAAYAKRP